MTKPINFKEALVVPQPSGAKYSGSVSEVVPLPVWTDGEQTVSCWKLSLRERFLALVFGRVWVSMLCGGGTQPPVSIVVHPTYFAGE